ncbi:MAG TPA: hypothetical protein VGW33_12955 [Terriglobia bacterium]|nr:hypothetical protein [Terriglobia bacterium]
MRQTWKEYLRTREAVEGGEAAREKFGRLTRLARRGGVHVAPRGDSGQGWARLRSLGLAGPVPYGAGLARGAIAEKRLTKTS